jgi:hypothetical protein
MALRSLCSVLVELSYLEQRLLDRRMLDQIRSIILDIPHRSVYRPNAHALTWKWLQHCLQLIVVRRLFPPGVVTPCDGGKGRGAQKFSDVANIRVGGPNPRSVSTSNVIWSLAWREADRSGAEWIVFQANACVGR